MEKKPRPISRQDLMKLAVTDADAFTALRYLRHRESSPSIPDLEEQGKQSLPGVEGSLFDLYHTLWSPEPSVREEVSPDRRYWQEMLKGAINSSAYAELHADTQLSELKSVLGTIAMGETFCKVVSKDDGEKLQELSEAQVEADGMQEAADEAQAQADALQSMVEAMQGQGQGGQAGSPTDGDGQPSNQTSPNAPQSGGGGKGQMSPEQAKALVNQIAEQWLDAQANADAAKQLADEAKAKAEGLAEDLLGQPGSQQAQDKMRELTRAGIAATKAAQAKVEDVSKTIEAWGLEEGELMRNGIPEAMGLLERMKRNEALKKFAALLGRMRKIAARKARSKQAGEGAKVTVRETGRDLKRVERSELVAIAHPALRAKALTRWARGELSLFGQEAKPKLGHGPVIVCEDSSGSMEGTKQQWAKAVVLSLAHYAKIQKRTFGWIMFDARIQRDKTYSHGQISAKEMLEIVESRSGGGTDFEHPLRRALEMVKQSGLKKADICFITDGECAVSDEFIRELKATKKAMEINIFTILCDVGSSADATVGEFSDRIEKASAFSAEEAESKIFGNL